MTALSFRLLPTREEDAADIECLLDACFGLARRTKTSYRFREGERPVEGLSFVALDDADRPVGSISFWHLRIGTEGVPALLLGPLAVCPQLRGNGIGIALMRHGLEEARRMGHRLVILVGDQPYYGRIGFQKVPEGRLILPGPVDPERLLYLELEPGALGGVEGLVLPPARFSALRGTTSC